MGGGNVEKRFEFGPRSSPGRTGVGDVCGMIHAGHGNACGAAHYGKLSDVCCDLRSGTP